MNKKEIMMNEYIKNINTEHEITIGVCESLWITGKELINLEKQGYYRFYAGEYNHEI
ncbi:hypothetical protein ACFL96_13705 [Thermoproteota archaeon]